MDEGRAEGLRKVYGLIGFSLSVLSFCFLFFVFFPFPLVFPYIFQRMTSPLSLIPGTPRNEGGTIGELEKERAKEGWESDDDEERKGFRRGGKATMKKRGVVWDSWMV